MHSHTPAPPYALPVSRLATEGGARVIAISRRPSSLDLARDHGAAETIAMDDHQAIIDRVGALTEGRFCERTIEAVGKQWPLDLAGELTAERGKLIVAGYHQDGRSEEHTSELKSLMRISYAVFCLKKKKTQKTQNMHNSHNTTNTIHSTLT